MQTTNATIHHAFTYRDGQRLAVATLDKPKRIIAIHGLDRFSGGQKVKVFQHTDNKYYAQ